MLLAISDSGRVAAAIGAGVLVGWLIPSVLVALRAERDGFPFWPYLVVALFLSWPLALTLTLLFGARSPLVTGRRTDGPT